MSKGFIPIRRSLFDHWLFNEKRVFSRFEAWLDLIQISTFQEDKTQIIKGKVITCKKGQVVASVRFLQKRWTWNSMNKVITYLELLRSQDMLLIDNECGINRLTLTNYNKHNSLSLENAGENANRNVKRNAKTRSSKGFDANSGTQTGTESGTQTGTRMEQQGNTDGTNKKEDNTVNTGEDIPATAVRTYTDADKTGFENFKAWISTNAGEVSKMEQPFTIDQYISLKKRYPNAADIRALLTAMHNWKPLRKNNRSAYLTIVNWKRREENK